MKPVTDPALLATLEGPEAVTDPALLAKLEGLPPVPPRKPLTIWNPTRFKTPGDYLGDIEGPGGLVLPNPFGVAAGAVTSTAKGLAALPGLALRGAAAIPGAITSPIETATAAGWAVAESARNAPSALWNWLQKASATDIATAGVEPLVGAVGPAAAARGLGAAGRRVLPHLPGAELERGSMAARGARGALTEALGPAQPPGAATPVFEAAYGLAKGVPQTPELAATMGKVLPYLRPRVKGLRDVVGSGTDLEGAIAARQVLQEIRGRIPAYEQRIATPLLEQLDVALDATGHPAVERFRQGLSTAKAHMTAAELRAILERNIASVEGGAGEALRLDPLLKGLRKPTAADEFTLARLDELDPRLLPEIEDAWRGLAPLAGKGTAVTEASRRLGLLQVASLLTGGAAGGGSLLRSGAADPFTALAWGHWAAPSAPTRSGLASSGSPAVPRAVPPSAAPLSRPASAPVPSAAGSWPRAGRPCSAPGPAST